MKKLFFAAIIAVFTMTSVNAQKFGAKAGLNIANVAFSGTYSSEINKITKSKIGFNFGGFAEFEISDKFSFQPELLFSTQGVKFEYSESEEIMGTTYTSSYESTTSLNYLNIPLMAKYYVAEGFSIQAGPQVGFLLSAKEEGSETNNGETTTFSDDELKDDMNSVDFALDFGLGYQMDSGLYFDARYNLGLADIAKDRDSGDDGKSKNNVISISVGYFFN